MMRLVTRLFLFFALLGSVPVSQVYGLITPRVLARCGPPDLPAHAVELLERNYYNEGDRLALRCHGGVMIGSAHNATHHNHSETAVVQCRGGTWSPKGFRCSALTPLDQTTSDQQTQAAENQEEETNVLLERVMDLSGENFAILSDRNPETCIRFNGNKSWSLPLNQTGYVTHVMLVVTHMEDHILHNRNQTSIRIGLPLGDRSVTDRYCTLADHSHSETLPVIFAVYHCDPHPALNGTDSAEVDILQPSKNVILEVIPLFGEQIRVCDLDVFAMPVQNCGLPEHPLYTQINFTHLTNGSLAADYSCVEGYEWVANLTADQPQSEEGAFRRICGHDSIWYPTTVPPQCKPLVTCPFLDETQTHNGTFMFAYLSRDLNGYPVGGVTESEYLCTRFGQEPTEDVRRFCQLNGTWSDLPEDKSDVKCQHKEMVMFGKFHLKKDKVMLMYVCCAAFLLIAAFGGLLLHSRRMARRLKRKWREDQYRSVSAGAGGEAGRGVPGFGVDNYYSNRDFSDWSDGELMPNVTKNQSITGADDDLVKNRF